MRKPRKRVCTSREIFLRGAQTDTANWGGYSADVRSMWMRTSRFASTISLWATTPRAHALWGRFLLGEHTGRLEFGGSASACAVRSEARRARGAARARSEACARCAGRRPRRRSEEHDVHVQEKCPIRSAGRRPRCDADAQAAACRSETKSCCDEGHYRWEPG